MATLVIFAVVLGLAVTLLLFLRINAGVAFLFICAGYMLATRYSSDASLAGAAVMKNGLATNVAYIALVLLPGVMVGLFLRKSVPATKTIFNILPALAVVALATLLIVPQLDSGVQSGLMDTVIWQNLSSFEPVVIIGGVLSSLILVILTKQTSRHRKHG